MLFIIIMPEGGIIPPGGGIIPPGAIIPGFIPCIPCMAAAIPYDPGGGPILAGVNSRIVLFLLAKEPVLLSE